MYQGCRLQRVARRRFPQPNLRQVPQFGIHERRQCLGRLSIALLGSSQHASDVAGLPAIHRKNRLI